MKTTKVIIPRKIGEETQFNNMHTFNHWRGFKVDHMFYWYIILIRQPVKAHGKETNILQGTGPTWVKSWEFYGL